jgi:hypothetical protein
MRETAGELSMSQTPRATVLTTRHLILGAGLVALLVFVAVGVLLVTRQNAPKAAPLSFNQTTDTHQYRMLLIVSPPQSMYTRAQVRAQHPTSGEVMFTGTMAMPPGMSGMPGMSSMSGSDYPAGWYHVEVHVYDRVSGAVVENASPVITIRDDTSGKTDTLAIVTMQSVVTGPSDFHYGNNAQLHAGDSYTLTARVGPEMGTFHFHL